MEGHRGVAVDVEAAHSQTYRSRDPIANLLVRVTLRRVAGKATTLPPQPPPEKPEDNANGTSDAEEEEQRLEREGEPTQREEAPPLAPPEQDVTTCVIQWQQKLFSAREVLIYDDIHRCQTAQARRHHEDLVQRRREGRLFTSRIFTYIDSDEFDDPLAGPHPVTDAWHDYPSFLVERMAEVRRRRGERHHGHNTHHVLQERDRKHHSGHVVSTPFQIMHIMADLSPPHSPANAIEEHILCTLKLDAHGVLTVSPDFSSPQRPYRIESYHSEVFEFTVEHASGAPSAADLRREAALLKELYDRQKEALENRVGMDFADAPPRGCRRVFVFGEIVAATDFEYDNLYAQLLWDIPPGWALNGGPDSLTTQLCQSGSGSRRAYFSFPFEFCATWTAEGKQKYPEQFPRLLFQVSSIDYWDRHRVEGYGQVQVPSTPGIEVHDVKTWRVVGNTHFGKMRRFFIGGAPELDDMTYIGVPHGLDGPILSRLGLRTEASGTLRVRLQTVQHRGVRAPRDDGGDVDEDMLDRFRGISEATASILQAFRRAHNRATSLLATQQTRKTVVAN